MKRRKGRIVSLSFGMLILLIVLGIQFLAGCDSANDKLVTGGAIYKSKEQAMEHTVQSGLIEGIVASTFSIMLIGMTTLYMEYRMDRKRGRKRVGIHLQHTETSKH